MEDSGLVTLDVEKLVLGKRGPAWPSLRIVYMESTIDFGDRAACGGPHTHRPLPWLPQAWTWRNPRRLKPACPLATVLRGPALTLRTRPWVQQVPQVPAAAGAPRPGGGL